MSRHPTTGGRARRPRFLAITVATALLLLAAPAALAGWLSPNTNNNAQDNFGAPIYTGACNDPNIADYLEIKNAWIANDGTNIYFAVETCGVTSGSYQNVRYAGGLDCTGDGDVSDGDTSTTYGDRKVVYTPPYTTAGQPSGDQVNVLDGKNEYKFQMPNTSYGERVGSSAVFEWYATLQSIYPECRSSTVVIKMGLGTAQTNLNPVIQDETPPVDWPIPIDYGDANNPNPQANPPTCTEYPTRLACDGARHGAADGLKLGALADPDTGGVYAANADGDDLANLADEDGAFPTAGVNWVKGGLGSLTAIVAGGSGYLNCWIDWNNDKDWADTGEKVVDNSAVASGENERTFTVSNSAANFPTGFIARCRLAPGSNQGSAVTGAVEFGEVEDHKWVFGESGNRPAAVTLAASVIDATGLQLSWTNIASNESYLILSSDAPYFDPGDAGVTTMTDPDNSSPYVVAGVVGGTEQSLYYVAQGQVTSSNPDMVSAPSNRVGLFEFALVAGG